MRPHAPTPCQKFFNVSVIVHAYATLHRKLTCENVMLHDTYLHNMSNYAAYIYLSHI